MKISRLLQEGIYELRKQGITDPVQKARLLLAHLLDKPKEYVMIHDMEEVSEDRKQQFKRQIEKLKRGMPLQYITHKQEFMKMEFYVDESVLIPQPDTEILVEESLDIIKNRIQPRCLDMCTGSGAIAISLAENKNDSIVYASDISHDAIQIAKYNEQKNRKELTIHWIEANLFEAEQIIKNKFDIIVSNPPYIATEIIPTLEKEVRQEPILALDGGVDGLNFYREIIRQSWKYIKKEGYLCLEIGQDQKQEVIPLLEQSEYYTEIKCKKDLAGKDRVIIAKRR